MYKKLIIAILLIILLSSITSCNNFSSRKIDTRIASVVQMIPDVSLNIELKPINAQANTIYTVDLYENNKLRERQLVRWNQPQINVKKSITMYFKLSGDETEAYFSSYKTNNNWWKSIFSVNVHE